jgi:predicted Rossmann-fold nucleotide-binding protein
LVVFPGGFGTLDELFELLTLSQTHKLSRVIPIVLYGTSYWKELIHLEALVRHGMIAEEDLDLFHYADQPQEALEFLRAALAPEAEAATPAFAKSSTPSHLARPSYGRAPRRSP